MALHVCRDFLTIGNPLTIVLSPNFVLYLQAIFLRTVLGYSIVGQTNFNIDGATLRKGSGVGGTLNQGGGDIYAFNPNGYVVSAADINRILAIRSTNNPMVNSGLFRVTGVDTTNNWLYINYRSGDTPPAETGLTWALYADENVFYSTLNATGNGIAGTYTGRGAATQSRIILQSPSSLNWQVRLAIENATDVYDGGVGPAYADNSIGGTTTPGYGGDSAGDFPAGGQHLHYPMWTNVANSSFLGNSIGLWPNSLVQGRFYAWGDDVTGTCFMAIRSVVVSGLGPSDGYVHFGLPEDEEQPLPPKNVQRLFVMGGSAVSAATGINWTSGFSTSRNGMAYGLSNTPISCCYSIYNPLDGTTYGSGNGIRNGTFAADNPYLQATELIPVDLMAGTQDSNNPSFGNTPEILVLEGRRLGRAPIVRLGRGNYGNFQVASDINRSWLHLNDGMYMPWQGSILP